MAGRTEKSAYIILITNFFESSVWGNGREQNGLAAYSHYSNSLPVVPWSSLMEFVSFHGDILHSGAFGDICFSFIF